MKKSAAAYSAVKLLGKPECRNAVSVGRMPFRWYLEPSGTQDPNQPDMLLAPRSVAELGGRRILLLRGRARGARRALAARDAQGRRRLEHRRANSLGGCAAPTPQRSGAATSGGVERRLAPVAVRLWRVFRESIRLGCCGDFPSISTNRGLSARHHGVSDDPALSGWAVGSPRLWRWRNVYTRQGSAQG
jgi:hypothetical protein